MELNKIKELLYNKLEKVDYEERSNYGIIDAIEETFDEAQKQGQTLPIDSVSNLLCGSFDADNSTSATKCKCGRDKWEHPKAT